MPILFKTYAYPLCRYLVGIACLVLPLNRTFGQQPAHFILGDEQFKGLQIYDVIQDEQLNYLFATNGGLYCFNYYSYEKIECPEAKSDIVFNFLKDKNGIIYCHNLNNQVFRIQGKKSTVFYELSSSESSADISLALDGSNHVLVGGKKLVILDQSGKPVKIHDHRAYLGQPYLTKKNTVVYHLGNTDSLLVWNNPSVEMKKIDGLSQKNNEVLRFFSFGDHTFAIGLTSKQVYGFDEEKMNLSPVKRKQNFEVGASIRLYVAKGDLWVAGTLPGVTRLHGNIERTDLAPFFTDYFISDVYSDHEGNILLSTFDRGVIVIPDLDVPDVIGTFEKDPISSLYVESDSMLMLGSLRGDFLQHKTNEEVKVLTQMGIRPIEGIYSTPTLPYWIYDDGRICFLHKKTGITQLGFIASLKDAVVVNDHLVYMGTNMGVLKYEIGDKEFHFSRVELLNMRCYAIEYNPADKILYVATSEGLFAMKESGTPKPVLHQNKRIFTNSLCYDNKFIYVGGKSNGLLKIQGTRVIEVLHPKIGDQPVELGKILITGNTLLAKSNNMLYAFTLSGQYKGNIGVQHGFVNHRVIDFAVKNNVLWVSHTGGVQKIMLQNKSNQISKPLVNISSILVNGIPLTNNSNNRFESDQRKIVFRLVSPSLRNRGRISFHYKLQGYENQWISMGPESNEVVYNALQPGNYSFMVRAENQGVYSGTSVFSFSISAPLYARWWFITLCLLLFLIAVVLVYRRQIAIQRKRANLQSELNALKLTAIQSQMNPHFIFNSLNAIQDLVLKGDVDNSYTFITKFSDLIRRTLTYSDKDFIDFEQEIKLLELYLSLEKLRFKSSLQYTIDTDSIDDIMIPPMLVQPFIENALLHGLLHKTGPKQLNIRFVQDDMLICVIEDNGIGREKAKEIKLRQGVGHESFSGQAIKKRFEILGQHFKGRLGFYYEDLVEDNEAKGTRVTLHIPVKHKY